MAEPYYTVDSLDADHSIGYLIKRCGIVMNQLAERHFESQPVSFTQWIVLIWLSQRPHASPTELSTHLGHDMGALTRLVDELEREGLVRRERSQVDRRAVEIGVTAEGRRMAHNGKRMVVELLNQLIAPYSATEIDALIAMLQRILVRLQDAVQSLEPAEPPPVKQRGQRRAIRTNGARSEASNTGARRKAAGRGA